MGASQANAANTNKKNKTVLSMVANAKLTEAARCSCYCFACYFGKA